MRNRWVATAQPPAPQIHYRTRNGLRGLPSAEGLLPQKAVREPLLAARAGPSASAPPWRSRFHRSIDRTARQSLCGDSRHGRDGLVRISEANYGKPREGTPRAVGSWNRAQAPPGRTDLNLTV